MWKKGYVVLLLLSAVTVIAYGAVNLGGDHLGYALVYALILVFGVPTMWIAGWAAFNGDDKET